MEIIVLFCSIIFNANLENYNTSHRVDVRSRLGESIICTGPPFHSVTRNPPPPPPKKKSLHEWKCCISNKMEVADLDSRVLDFLSRLFTASENASFMFHILHSRFQSSSAHDRLNQKRKHWVENVVFWSELTGACPLPILFPRASNPFGQREDCDMTFKKTG